jgi:hypothetical protein
MPGTAPLSPIASDICLRDLSFRKNLRMMIRENIVLRGKLGRQHCPSGEEVGDLLADMEKRNGNEGSYDWGYKVVDVRRFCFRLCLFLTLASLTSFFEKG